MKLIVFSIIFKEFNGNSKNVGCNFFGNMLFKLPPLLAWCDGRFYGNSKRPWPKVVGIKNSIVEKLRPTLSYLEFNEEPKNVGRNFPTIKILNSHHFWPWRDG